MRIIIAVFASILIFSACDDDSVDVTPPEIDIQGFTPAPSPGMICGTMEDSVFTLKGGEALGFVTTFRDDGALSEYKIDIHNNFDCHGHGGAATPGINPPGVENQTTDWTILDITPLNGKEAQVARTLNVPENVTAGTYHFQIQVLDESGNDNPLANFYSLQVFNPIDIAPPSITVSSPSGGFSVAKGESINFQGEVADDFSLSQGGNGLLFLSYTDLSSGNTFTTDAVFPFDGSVDKNYSFDFDYTVPGTLTSGNYIFTLRAHDGVRNVAEVVEFEVEVM